MGKQKENEEIEIKIIDKATEKIIGEVITNHSLTFDDAMELAGFDYIELENESGWTEDCRVFYNEGDVEMDYDD